MQRKCRKKKDKKFCTDETIRKMARYPRLFKSFKNPKTLDLQGFSGSFIFACALTLQNICGILEVSFAEQRFIPSLRDVIKGGWALCLMF
jgi:hypothetical protein